MLDGVDLEEKNYMHHYNFGYSVGEAKRKRSRRRNRPWRACRALEPVIPSEEFPYAIRLVSKC